ncbi:uncharacterized protein I303_105354 [Kwoniella dejecticola CBS 10117]|uniref:Uncharacterized protein n=1 Tax=Kwoniella dejecticola CBS 10117 TaxID=1296121 RepID=A0A1A6A2Q8_9TREE|nr:uncharacterized protein I303_05199 [Kwoniella dejecticola CBS 10117]OBR84341.1 hypothetical protein I303_05199 [Kwoniella dejecticola CBS 10117]
MDYLTIITTRSLILFPPSSSLPPTMNPHRPLPDSPLSSPITPTPALTPMSELGRSLLHPSEITLPISSLIYNEANCAYYLNHHVITTSPSNPFSSAEYSSERGRKTEVEVMVYKELDRVKMFTRALGRWFNQNSSRMDEGTLGDLANKYGLSLEDVHNQASKGQGGQAGHHDGDEMTVHHGHDENGKRHYSDISKEETALLV